MDRRTFLRWMAGAGAVPAGFPWQRYPDRWVSDAEKRPHVAPGLWTIFATTCRECPAGCGMHVRTREGRVVKPEGNPDHPVSHGGLCPRGQSAPQGLYDPDRVRRPLRRAGTQKTEKGGRKKEGRGQKTEDRGKSPSGFEPVSWEDALKEVAGALKNARRLFIVSDLQTGALAEIMQQFHEATGLPGQVAFYEAFACEPLRAANQRVFGRPVIPRYRLQECDLIVSFAAEFLETWISNVEFAWQFAQMHHKELMKEEGRWMIESGRGGLTHPSSIIDHPSSMVYIGPQLSLTAANADHFLRIPVGHEYAVAMAILQEVARLRGSSISDFGFRMSDFAGGTESNPQSAIRKPQLQEVARWLASAKNAVVLGGPVAATGPAAENLAAAAMLLNQTLGAVGRAVDFSQVHALGRTTPAAQLEPMLADLGPDDFLIVHQTNPAYSLPRVREYIERVNNVVYVGTMLDETAQLARWVLPVHSPLEAWGDYEPWTGIHCLMQPAMGPVFDTRSGGEVFLALAAQAGRPLGNSGEPPASFYDRLRLDWRRLQRQVAPDTEFETFWQQALQRGGVFQENQLEPAPKVQGGKLTLEVPGTSPEGMQLWLWPSIMLFDGRPANRGWMQEVPERMSTIAWGSWVDISPATAQRLAIADGDVVEVSNQSGAVQAPARITDDVADNVVALALGQGHTALGETAAGRGVNAFVLRASPDRDSLFGAVELRKTGGHARPIRLSATQDQHGRGLVRWTTPGDLRTRTKNEIEEIVWPGPRGYDPHRDLYAPHEYKEHRWAMVVDLDRCIGCGACEVACYAENNIPVVGPGPLAKGREMSWLKIPPYRHPDEPLRVGFLPLPCQHCDAAPCEPVCPVFAAVHNDQGLNAQIYNRCIGTRYCSNNCPYKVRRFEWFDPHWRAPLHLQLNPDVTVRCRGVMEKCTFCIQRIYYQERRAKVEGRPLREGEVQPACVQSCPTRAYVFGDLMNPNAQVSRLFEHPRRYQLLRELNTKPAVLYLRRIQPDRREMA